MHDEIVFDTNSGISEEEQREILAKINSITEKNRLSLGHAIDANQIAGNKSGKKGKKRFKAKKTGGLFPILVNAAAIAALTGGFLMLFFFQGKTDAQVREGTRIINSAERVLIDEIMRETSIDSARSEMERLSQEQAQAAAIESQIGAFFANLNSQIDQNLLDDAARTVQSMRAFLNTPAFQSIRSIQARKEVYTQAINVFEIMVAEARKTQAFLAAGVMPLDRNNEKLLADLQEKSTELEKTIESLGTEGSGMARRIVELEGNNNNLRAANTALEYDLAAQTQNAQSLQAEVATLNQTIRTRDNTISNLGQQNRNQETTIANLNNQLTIIRQVLQDSTREQIPEHNE